MAETIFGPQLFPQNSPPQLRVLVSNLSHNIPVTIFLDSNSSLPDSFETKLICTWQNLSTQSRDTALQKILETVRTHYLDHAPRFSHSPFLRTHPDSGELTVEEKLDPRLLHKLKLPEEIIPPSAPTQPKLYPVSSLHTCPLSPTSPRSWSSQIQLITLSPQLPSGGIQPKKYIAKGPSANNFSELITLLSLPEHPNIIPSPHALITVSDTDRRVVGFLLEYYPCGSLDEFSAGLKCGVAPETLWRWGRQLVDAVHWLHVEQHTFHGDIKPDNIVIRRPQSGKGQEEEEELVLIDFSQDASTAATAPPEAQGGAFPRTWGREALEKADVYALGRTLYILAKGVGMDVLYMQLFRDVKWVYETDLEGLGGAMREVVEMCTRLDPRERPGLGELKRIFEGGCARVETGVSRKRRLGWVMMSGGVKRRLGGGIGGLGAMVGGVRQVLGSWRGRD